MAQNKVHEIGDRLFAAFQAAVPLAGEPGGKRPKDRDVRQRAESGMARFLEAARQERLGSGLGMIERAKVAFYLQQKLIAAGYAAPLVKQVLFAMLVSAFVGR
jgi:hypothetical protein